MVQLLILRRNNHFLAGTLIYHLERALSYEPEKSVTARISPTFTDNGATSSPASSVDSEHQSSIADESDREAATSEANDANEASEVSESRSVTRSVPVAVGKLLEPNPNLNLASSPSHNVTNRVFALSVFIEVLGKHTSATANDELEAHICAIYLPFLPVVCVILGNTLTLRAFETLR